MSLSTARLLEVLTRAGVTLGRTPRGELVTLGLPEALAPAVAAARVELALAVAGTRRLAWVSDEGKRSTRSHQWRRCTSCRREQLVSSSTANGSSCGLTPGCAGKLRRLEDSPPLGRDPALVPIANLLALMAPSNSREARALALLRCTRPGCGRVATHRTSWLEPVCDADFLHLALANVTERTPTP